MDRAASRVVDGSRLKGAFGRKINKPWIWGGLCAVFFIGLANFRRLLSIRNLDLLVLLSFTASLWFFNQGEIFTSVPLAYPPCSISSAAWAGSVARAGRPSRRSGPCGCSRGDGVPRRLPLRHESGASNVIDVGCAGVIGAQRIVQDGEMPYGNLPEDDGAECGAGRCQRRRPRPDPDEQPLRVVNGRGDTYGPISYMAYVPGYLAMGWTSSGIPARCALHALFLDGFALLGLGAVGFRFGGARLGVTLRVRVGGVSVHQYVSSSNSNDAIMPAFLIWGFGSCTSPRLRAACSRAWPRGRSSPPSCSSRSGPRTPRRRGGRGSSCSSSAASCSRPRIGFWIVFLEPDPLHAARVFWDRTFGWQLSRPSPFSIWDWKEYAGFPDLHVSRRC